MKKVPDIDTLNLTKDFKKDRMISAKSPVMIESGETIRTLHPEYEKDIVKLEADRRDFIKHEN